MQASAREKEGTQAIRSRRNGSKPSGERGREASQQEAQGHERKDQKGRITQTPETTKQHSYR